MLSDYTHRLVGERIMAYRPTRQALKISHLEEHLDRPKIAARSIKWRLKK
jgi:hypothetical protein